jgi:hypothetical protein
LFFSERRISSAVHLFRLFEVSNQTMLDILYLSPLASLSLERQHSANRSASWSSLHAELRNLPVSGSANPASPNSSPTWADFPYAGVTVYIILVGVISRAIDLTFLCNGKSPAVAVLGASVWGCCPIHDGLEYWIACPRTAAGARFGCYADTLRSRPRGQGRANVVGVLTRPSQAR